MLRFTTPVRAGVVDGGDGGFCGGGGGAAPASASFDALVRGSLIGLASDVGDRLSDWSGPPIGRNRPLSGAVARGAGTFLARLGQPDEEVAAIAAEVEAVAVAAKPVNF